MADRLAHRDALLAQPNEFFRDSCGGRVPGLQEKLFLVEQAVARVVSIPVFENEVYRVEVTNRPPYIMLGISRKDGRPGKCWRDFQNIKNQLVGPEHEAVELFPAESRLLESARQYHLWVHADPKFRFPLGFAQRFVLNEPLRFKRRPGFDLTSSPGDLVPADSIARSLTVSVSSA